VSVKDNNPPEVAANVRGRRRRTWVTIAAAAATLMVGTVVAVNATAASAATVDTNAWYTIINRGSGKLVTW